MKGEFKTQEAAFYCFYHNYDPDDITKSDRDSCVRQGSQLNKQLIENKDTPTIRFYKYWCKNNLYDFVNKCVIENDLCGNNNNNDEPPKIEDGVVVNYVKELKVWNDEDECYEEYNEARVKTLIKINDTKSDQLHKALAGRDVSDLKYKIATLKDKLKQNEKNLQDFQAGYKEVIQQRNRMENRMEKAGWAKSLLIDYEKLKRFYMDYSKSPIDN
jgi:hypothetical protein